MVKGRAPCCDRSKVRTGPWSTAEDLRLTTFVQKNGHANWRALPKQAGILRCGKSCRLRWVNYLSPNVKRGNFSPEEEQIIINMHTSIGNKWSKIASCLPGRTDNEIKNVWNTHLKKRLLLTTNNNIITEATQSSPCSSSYSSTTTTTTTTTGEDQEMGRVEKPESTELITSSTQDDNQRELVENIPADIDNSTNYEDKFDDGENCRSNCSIDGLVLQILEFNFDI
ncbi:hypothetical protein ABFS83_13G145600 [Erythranthe nasuta]